MCEMLKNCGFALETSSMIALRAALFTALGNISGYLINYTFNVMKPSFFKTDFVDPWNAGICAGIFVVIDFFAQTLFEKMLGQECAHKPLTVMARISLCIPIAAFFCTLEGLTIPLVAATAAIICAVAGFVFINHVAMQYQKTL